MFGYDHGELVGQPLQVLIPKKHQAKHPSHVEGFMKDHHARQMGQGLDLFGLRKDGSMFPVEAGLNPFALDNHKYVMAVVIDITIRREQQDQIIALNEQLEQKIEERTRELHETVKELKAEVIKRKQIEDQIKASLQKERELNELKTKFLSLVSHEFKTPLSGILTSATLAGKYTQSEQQDKREKHLATIRNKVKYLTNILNDFLSIERLETGKVSYNYSRFPLSKVLNEVVYDANMLLKEGQHISYPEHVDEIELEFDEKILELVLTNLINNAVKYSGEGSTVDLRVHQEGEKLTIEVKDTGIGIPEKEQKHIFNRYFRAENALLNQGTGIGLNIVKTHLENLGGTITFSSIENQGSTFTVQIPLQGPEN
jgi:PAS domain S-box-containing protein